MSFRNLKFRDRDFIHHENNRIISQMNSNTKYLAMTQAFEAAKSRMNEAYMQMQLEDDLAKKRKWAGLAERYADEANQISDNWENKIRRDLRRGRRFKLLLWFMLIALFIVVFPVNLIFIYLFIMWLIRHYIVLKDEYRSIPVQEQESPTIEIDSSLYAKAESLTEQIKLLYKRCEAWLETLQEELGLDGAQNSEWVDTYLTGDMEMSTGLKKEGQTLLVDFQSTLNELEFLSHVIDDDGTIDFCQSSIDMLTIFLAKGERSVSFTQDHEDWINQQISFLEQVHSWINSVFDSIDDDREQAMLAYFYGDEQLSSEQNKEGFSLLLRLQTILTKYEVFPECPEKDEAIEYIKNEISIVKSILTKDLSEN